MVTPVSVPPVPLGRETTVLQFSHLILGSLLNFNETAIKIAFISDKVTYAFLGTGGFCVNNNTSINTEKSS